MASRLQQKWRGQPTSFQSVQKQLNYVDLVIEVVDARAPQSSRHPQALKIFGTKPRLIVMAKEDLADPTLNRYWQQKLSCQPKQNCLLLSLKQQKGKTRLLQSVIALAKPNQDRLGRRGLLPRPIRICIVGMPNVGKSTLINWFIGRSRAQAGNLPGITKGPQWIRIHPQVELLDTPGVLPSRQLSPLVAFKLALLNLISPQSYELEETARAGLKLIGELYPVQLREKLGNSEAASSLESFAHCRRLLKSGGNLDIMRAASLFLQELRNAKLGRITLDREDIACR